MLEWRSAIWKTPATFLIALFATACGDSSPIDLLASEADAAKAMDGGEDSSGKACGTDGDCSPPLPYCDMTRNRCVECLTSSNCTTGVCDPLLHACVECSEASQCHDAHRPICLPDARVCAQCGSDADCFGESSHCEPVTHRCVECLQDGHCADGACNSDFECGGG